VIKMRLNKNPRCPKCGGLAQKHGTVSKVGSKPRERFQCSKCGNTFFNEPDMHPKYITMLMKDKNGEHEVLSCWICGYSTESKDEIDAHFEDCQKKGK